MRSQNWKKIELTPRSRILCSVHRLLRLVLLQCNHRLGFPLSLLIIIIASPLEGRLNMTFIIFFYFYFFYFFLGRSFKLDFYHFYFSKPCRIVIMIGTLSSAPWSVSFSTPRTRHYSTRWSLITFPSKALTYSMQLYLFAIFFSTKTFDTWVALAGARGRDDGKLQLDRPVHHPLQWDEESCKGILQVSKSGSIS